MAIMISDSSKKKIPTSLEECTKPTATVSELKFWSKQLEEWGKVLFYVLIVVGVISTLVNTFSLVDVNEEMMLPTFITTAITWALYAFIEYCTYHVLALLVSALASITHDNCVTANVALLTASQNPDLPKEAPTAVPTEAPKNIFASVQTKKPTWNCPHCGETNKGSQSRCEMCGRERN